MLALTNGKIVLKDSVLEQGTVLIEDGFIADVLTHAPCLDHMELLDAKGAYVGPGFVDLHCHGGGGFWMREDPVRAALHHLQSGTTSLLATFAYSETEAQITAGLHKAREAMQKGNPGNILGVFLEGPFLNPKYGANAQSIRPYSLGEYERLMHAGEDILRMWTVAPEMPSARTLIDALVKKGIAVAMGHSEASVEDVNWAVDHGARVCTHLMDATGASISPPRYGGTRECGFDEAVMLRDEVFCEVIADRRGAHVRHDMIRFILKAVGLERVAAVTDCCAQTEGGDDINLVNDELSGSKLTLLMAAKNLQTATGLSMPSLFRLCATNPARAIRQDDVGTIEKGKRANLVLVDGDFQLHGVLLNGKRILSY
ncbi:amidohydrolase family protein [Christensenellaceae bacterium OttesenSCG-928-M15]|nr:amidohydrolase family protein [Christensenellaceae bacterium OttesenSCG-928-M15]